MHEKVDWRGNGSFPLIITAPAMASAEDSGKILCLK